ncbi:MAG: glycosyltransferase family 4 protein [Chloroflexi bacterium]|nr:glycosyltransferase family 4 protein [Chloroflexota bacterium]
MKIAFVTPWYGPDIPGGAEAETRRTAVHLHRAGYEVEILTTCIRDFFADWGKNHHKPGVTIENGLTVRRFRVEKRDKRRFDDINRRLMSGRKVDAASEQIFINEMFRAPDLYQFIEKHGDEYIFFFIPYLFASSYFGMQIHPERTAVIPCLHDEGYAYMDIFQETLPAVRALAFNTVSESRLATQLYGAATKQFRMVVGIGVETRFEFSATRFRHKYNLDKPFALYVGRRSTGKNTPLLLNYWQRYVQATGTEVKLVLIGPGEVAISAELAPYLVDLGFVPLQDKYDAYSAASFLCQPSRNESFSLVMMESWLTETPVLVHAGCEVTRNHCTASNGGLFFANFDEFAATTDYLLQHRKIARHMGQNGRQYVLDNYQWPTVIEKYRQIINLLAGGTGDN